MRDDDNDANDNDANDNDANDNDANDNDSNENDANDNDSNDEADAQDDGEAKPRFPERMNTLRINTNIGDLINPMNTDSLSSSLERLSVGLRINSGDEEDRISIEYGSRQAYVGYDRRGNPTISPMEDDGLSVEL